MSVVLGRSETLPTQLASFGRPTAARLASFGQNPPSNPRNWLRSVTVHHRRDPQSARFPLLSDRNRTNPIGGFVWSDGSQRNSSRIGFVRSSRPRPQNWLRFATEGNRLASVGARRSARRGTGCVPHCQRTLLYHPHFLTLRPGNLKRFRGDSTSRIENFTRADQASKILVSRDH